MHGAVIDYLQHRGASFMVELAQAVRPRVPSLTLGEWEAVIWDLVWAGRLTNDTFAPLRALGAPRRRGGRGAQVPAGGR